MAALAALLDVNVLIALLDADHVSHATALAWFGEHAERGWASCPITQNGCMRVMSHPNYPNAPSVSEVAVRLRSATSHRAHRFWADNVSLLDDAVFDTSRVHGPRQLTDAYLLALAVANEGRFVTFDRTIPLTAVHGAKPRHVHIL
jgi:toxin-antitoxin system PIN domain toxin